MFTRRRRRHWERVKVHSNTYIVWSAAGCVCGCVCVDTFGWTHRPHTARRNAAQLDAQLGRRDTALLRQRLGDRPSDPHVIMSECRARMRYLWVDGWGGWLAGMHHRRRRLRPRGATRYVSIGAKPVTSSARSAAGDAMRVREGACQMKSARVENPRKGSLSGHSAHAIPPKKIG
jgi:hypothetical protein